MVVGCLKFKWLVGVSEIDRAGWGCLKLLWLVGVSEIDVAGRDG